MLIKHSINISCTTQKVWKATTDIDRWPDWAPTVQAARRLDKQRFGLGSQARIKQPMQSRAIWTVTDIEEGQYFTWETEGKAIRMQATHRVASHRDGTNSTLEVKLIGSVAMICSVIIAPLIWLALTQENRGLKRWCEAARRPKPIRQIHGPDPSAAAKKQISGPAKLN